MLDLGPERPIHSLIYVFLAWKAVLLAVAIGSGIGRAYDTSSTLVSYDIPSGNEPALDIATRLMRWDAIYFIQSAQRGHVFEQEWAFGVGFPALISAIVKTLTWVGYVSNTTLAAAVGAGIAHVSHLLSVIALYELGLTLHCTTRTSLVAAILHILSPAGLFLSAPYNEAPFAFLSFAGYLLFARGYLQPQPSGLDDVLIVTSGAVLGAATTFRSNGLLSGITFALAFIWTLRELLTNLNLTSFRRLMALGIGGIAIAAGSIAPQAVAYVEFCSEASGLGQQRPWCSRAIPSIYSFVQEHYWNVGFLRYWTPSNIPLFALAAPMLYILIISGAAMAAAPLAMTQAGKKPVLTQIYSTKYSIIIWSMAGAQLLLAVLAIFTYHIQIITRVSSAYPLWYWWLAGVLESPKGSKFGGNLVVFMVMYAMIQGVLFASFLPPA